jgi:hypothetical protein
MTLAKSTSLTNVYDYVYSAVNTGITDPLSRDKQWILDKSSDDVNLIGFPIITINIMQDKEYKVKGYSDDVYQIEFNIFDNVATRLDELANSLDVIIDGLDNLEILDMSGDKDNVSINKQSVSYRSMNYKAGVIYD